MSNMTTAIAQAELMLPPSGIPLKTRTKHQVAKRVFQLAASGGFPYTGQTYKDWAKKWLTSESFKLMEIDINAAASPHLPKNPERVAYRLMCQVQSTDPIVVDMNKQKTGKSHLGYIPEIVVLDGKHRKQAQLLQGRTRILAWVGCRAEKKIKNATLVKDISFRNMTVPITTKRPSVIVQATHLHTIRASSMTTAFNLHCNTVPATGQVMLDQTGGEDGPGASKIATVKAKTAGKCPKCGSTKFSLMPTDFETAKCKKCGKNFQVKAAGGAGGGMGGPGMSNTGGSGSNPLMKSAGAATSSGNNTNLGPGVPGKNPSGVEIMHSKSKVKAGRDCRACAPTNISMGQLEDPSASDNEKVPPDASDDGSFVSASDRRKWQFPKEEIRAPGHKGWEGRSSPSQQSPGSGVGPRVKRSTGATRSEMSRLVHTVPDVDAGSKVVKKIYTKAPPGHEKQVLKLKEKYGEDSSTPFKIAWADYNKEMEAQGK
jgi:hypothetical protein